MPLQYHGLSKGSFSAGGPSAKAEPRGATGSLGLAFGSIANLFYSSLEP
jgi:hypothetical protein